MQIYVINLSRRPDRLAQIGAALSALELPFSRVEAIDGMAADLGQPAAHRLPAPAYACYLSHIKAYSAFLETGDSHCVIMEDDVALSPHLPAALAASCFYSDQNAIVRLEAPTNIQWHLPSYSKPKFVAKHNGLATYKLTSKSYGTGAFVLPRSIAKTLLAKHANPFLPIDLRLFHQRRSGHPGFNILQFDPALVIQRQYIGGVDDSDIKRVKNKPHRFSSIHPVLRNIIGNLRKVFRAIARLTGCNRRFPFARK